MRYSLPTFARPHSPVVVFNESIRAIVFALSSASAMMSPNNDYSIKLEIVSLVLMNIFI